MSRIAFLLAVFFWMLPAAAQAQWREASTNHFIVYSETSLETLKEFAQNLERYDAALRLLNGVPESDIGKANRVTVFMVSGLQELQSMMGNNRFVAGFYIPRAGGSIAVVPARSGTGDYDLGTQTILLHEYAHHFMWTNFPSAYPGWYREGFAEFAGETKFGKDGSVTVGNAPKSRIYGLLRGTLSLETMLSLNYGKLDSAEMDALYGRGWLLTHYLTFSDKRKGQLTKYLDAINRGLKGPEAAKAAFGDVTQLRKETESYARGRNMPGVKIQGSALPIGSIAVRTMSAAESAVMDVRVRSRRGVTPDQAKILIPKARKAATPYPHDPFVQSVLAEAEFDAGNLDAAEAAADRALASNPKAIDALIYKGRARLARAKQSGTTDAATWKEARNWLLTANKIDPDHPEPLIQFYDSFVIGEKIEPTASAVIAIYRAHDLAPEDFSVRMRAGQRYLKEGKAAAARRAIAPIAFNPHGGPTATWMTEILDALDARGSPAALEVWQAGPKKQPTSSN